MRELVYEALLRLVKPGVAALLAVPVWLLAVGPGGAAPSAELALLSWLAGAGFVLLAQESPI